MLRSPKPPSLLGKQRASQATLAPLELSRVPFHKKEVVKLLISCLTRLGRRKAEVQNPTIPEITVEINLSRPAKLRRRWSQPLGFLLIWEIRGSQSLIVSFLEHSGRPRYLTGRLSEDRRNFVLILSRGSCGRPEENMEVLWMLTARPDSFSNWERMVNTQARDFSEPSEKISKSSAKARWVSWIWEQPGW